MKDGACGGHILNKESEFEFRCLFCRTGGNTTDTFQHERRRYIKTEGDNVIKILIIHNNTCAFPNSSNSYAHDNFGNLTIH